jgi:glycerophosphoryl diester phosphodiesterase
MMRIFFRNRVVTHLWLLVFLLPAGPLPTQAQLRTYSVKNAHSHNDYEQSRPFYAAYALGFGSIEADVFLKEGELYVAHNWEDIKPERTLKALYLDPLLEKIQQNKGWPYANRRELQLLIDFKNDGQATLNELQKQLAPHRKALSHVRIVISGNMPAPDKLSQQDPLFTFDGRKNLIYSKEASPRVVLVSSNIADFGPYWDGTLPMAESTRQNISTFIALQHAQKKLVRLWGTPNTERAYQTLKELGVDYIGTDDLNGLAAFLTR